jgi:hypothetical protein
MAAVRRRINRCKSKPAFCDNNNTVEGKQRVGGGKSKPAFCDNNNTAALYRRMDYIKHDPRVYKPRSEGLTFAVGGRFNAAGGSMMD